MEAEFYLSEKHDKYEHDPVNAKLKIIKHVDGTQSIQFQACGKFVTLELMNNDLRLLECSHEFIVEGMKL